MLATRIIPCLDVEDGKVVKGVRFKEVRYAGDPVELARSYNNQGADEIVFLDIGATHRGLNMVIELVEKVSDCIFIPLTVGGGIRSTDDMGMILNAGADKVAVCSAAAVNPLMIADGASIFGSQCIVLSIDAKKSGASWAAFTGGGREDSGMDAIEWARVGEALGAGEILLNSIDNDGVRSGYDIELTRRVSESVSIPVIASGGAGNVQQILEAVTVGKADAVLIASLLHYGECTVGDIKSALRSEGVTVR